MDFIRGAALCPDGKPIIALPSTTKKGESRIVGMLKPGAGVVTTRAHVHYVVTEVRGGRRGEIGVGCIRCEMESGSQNRNCNPPLTLHARPLRDPLPPLPQFGIAYLFGKSLRERAHALIGIAHPSHRDELTRVARERALT
jgi:4-hydroxybutyrate CoA-transferase